MTKKRQSSTEAAHREADERYAAAVERAAASLPPLTPEQRARLVRLLHGAAA